MIEPRTRLKLSDMAAKRELQSSILPEARKRLAELRESKKHSPEMVAEGSGGGVSGQTIRKFEEGERSITIEKLDAALRALGSNLGEFFMFTLPPEVISDQDKYLQYTIQKALKRDEKTRKAVEALVFLLKRDGL